MTQDNQEKIKELQNLFGSYRAEWLRNKIYQFFTFPAYFNALKGTPPCVLQGGRGTGKTTVLKGLSYQGQYALSNNLIEKFDSVEFIGLYHRINTNHVRAFTGSRISEEKWNKIFGHYFNLIMCYEILNFISWHKEKKEEDQNLISSDCNLIASSLNINKNCNDSYTLLENLTNTLYDFESIVNGLTSKSVEEIQLSMMESPIGLLVNKTLQLKQFENKTFYILLDEYENLEDYQQCLLNTVIKHCSEGYTFKIGVRELGWRIKHTINKNEFLNDPADYILIDIEKKLNEEKSFNDFAQDVCQQRIRNLLSNEEKNKDYFLENALPGLSMEDEAITLGVSDLVQSERNNFSKDKWKIINNLTPLYQFFVIQWAKSNNIPIDDIIDDYAKNTSSWNVRYDNYKYETLFKIRKGRGTSGIQKYYTGWNTYSKLAKGNIRYLMELVYHAYERHLQEGKSILEPVSNVNQTLAAKEVGRKNLIELESLWMHGAKLTRLLLGLGRIFNVLISEEGKVAPEVNQIKLEGLISGECKDIITAAVMNLALVRLEGNKLSSPSSTKESLYTIHPIYAPYFVFGYRKKRTLSLSGEQILGIINKPKEFISSILRNKGVIEPELPSQLDLFNDYYNQL